MHFFQDDITTVKKVDTIKKEYHSAKVKVIGWIPNKVYEVELISMGRKLIFMEDELHEIERKLR